MPRLILLLRGVNLVSRNRVSMPELRAALADAGYEGARTYVQSGNVVLATRRRPERARSDVAALVADRFGIDVGVVVRTREELAEVVARDPLAAVATDPRLSQVTFLESGLGSASVRALEEFAAHDERIVAVGREIYTWHPRGSQGSKLARRLSGTSLGLATTRNWRTVTTLLGMADE